MRKSQNMMLRGGVYYLRVAVSKTLRATRAEQRGRSSKEVWKAWVPAMLVQRALR